MSQLVKPVAPSVKDVRAQIDAAIEGTRVKIKSDKAANTAKLHRSIGALTAALARASNPDKQRKLLSEHQAIIRAHEKEAAELERLDKEHRTEVEQLNEDLDKMDDLGD